MMRSGASKRWRTHATEDRLATHGPARAQSAAVRGTPAAEHPVARLQRQVGNNGVVPLLAQRQVGADLSARSGRVAVSGALVQRGIGKKITLHAQAIGRGLSPRGAKAVHEQVDISNARLDTLEQALAAGNEAMARRQYVSFRNKFRHTSEHGFGAKLKLALFFPVFLVRWNMMKARWTKLAAQFRAEFPDDPAIQNDALDLLEQFEKASSG